MDQGFRIGAAGSLILESLTPSVADPEGTPGAHPASGPDSFVLTYKFYEM